MAHTPENDPDPRDCASGEEWFAAPVEIPITDELDLHTFNPRELGELIPEYLRACREQGILTVRVVHGKGQGILKQRVRSILKKIAQVHAFSDASPEAGGWGATIIHLHPLK